jgi:dTDP-4-amino-4,6-dideoxygalactose transaminase
MRELQWLCQKWDLALIADGAHALGAVYWGHPIASCSDYTMISFQAIKQLTCGDGGLLAMTDEAKYHEARRRRWFGIDRVNRESRLDGYSFWNQSEVGYKMHMNDVAAAIGLGNLENIEAIDTHRRGIASFYRRALADVPGVTLFEQKNDRVSGNWLFTMHVERRDDFCRMMRDKGVEVSVVHIRNDLHDVFGPRRDDLPNTDRYEQTNISIPLHNGLSPDDVCYIIGCIKGGW